MTDVSDRNFGFLIAYLIPGFVVVVSFANHSSVLTSWLGLSGENTGSVGGFLYVTMASMAAGMLVSALRWLVIDTIHHRSGVAPPELDFSTFSNKHAAFAILAENHYRYAQHYGNLLVALLLAAINGADIIESVPLHPGISVTVFIVLLALLFIASRDALRKYYQRTSELLSTRETGSSLGEVHDAVAADDHFLWN